MPLNRKENQDYSTSKSTLKKPLIGLDTLKSCLEKDYFAKVTIVYSTACFEEENLAIEMNCNISLLEMLFHIQQGNWGNTPSLNKVYKGSSLFGEHLQYIRDENQTTTDIEELSIILKDCTIVIKKIAPESIEQEIDVLLNVLAENYVYITKHLTVTPMELFIPVYEEVSSANHSNNTVGSKKIIEKGYYSYWGVYYNEEEEAMIYDLYSKSIIAGDLDLLNL